MQWVTDQLFMAFSINDLQSGAAQVLTVYFDPDGSGGAPDNQDRAFWIGRDGTLRSGVFSSSGWTWLDNNENWSAAIFEGPNGMWTTELGINAALVMPAMLSGDDFGLSIYLGQDGQQGAWPDGAQPTNAGSWQLVNNDLCD